MSVSPKDLLMIFTGIAVVLAAFATGVRAAGEDPLWLAKHPRLLLRSLLVILIAVPSGTILFLEMIGAPPIVKAALTIAVLAIGIGPPAALKKAKVHQDSVAYEVGLNVILLTIAIVYIPLAVALHGAVFNHQVRLGVGPVAQVVLLRALGPLLLGILVGRLFPRVRALSRYAETFVQLVMLSVIVFALFATWRQLFELGAVTWLTCSAVVAGEVVLGHLVGSGDAGSRRMLVAFSAVRFPALALLLASAAPRFHDLVPVILAYVLTSIVFVAIYELATSGRKPRGRPALPTPLGPTGPRAAAPGA